MKKILLPAILILFFSFLVALPYFHPGFFPTHDGGWAVVRLADMIRGLKDGQFPVRYSGFLNHGYGYALFNFDYPFPYYLGAVIQFVSHLGIVNSIKALFVLSVPLSGIAMFLLLKEYWEDFLILRIKSRARG